MIFLGVAFINLARYFMLIVAKFLLCYHGEEEKPLVFLQLIALFIKLQIMHVEH